MKKLTNVEEKLKAIAKPAPKGGWKDAVKLKRMEKTAKLGEL